MTAAAGFTVPASYFVKARGPPTQQLAGLDLREAETFANCANFFGSDFESLLPHIVTIMVLNNECIIMVKYIEKNNTCKPFSRSRSDRMRMVRNQESA